jgi:hypothetical protein
MTSLEGSFVLDAFVSVAQVVAVLVTLVSPTNVNRPGSAPPNCAPPNNPPNLVTMSLRRHPQVIDWRDVLLGAVQYLHCGRFEARADE